MHITTKLTIPATATCRTCSKPFIPPSMASLWGGNATTCRACAEAALKAERRRSATAYTATVNSGIRNR